MAQPEFTRQTTSPAQHASGHKRHTLLETATVAIAVLAFLAAASQLSIANDTEKRQLRDMSLNRHTLLETATKVATVVIAVLAFLAAAWQGFITNDTEKRQLRAYVYMSGISLEAIDTNGTTSWFIKPIWRNAGLTPTRNMTIISRVITYGKIQGGWGSMGPVTSPAVLGPKEETVVEITGDAISSDIGDFQARGVAAYRDVFGHWRVTLSCRAAFVFNKDLTKPAVGTVMKIDSQPCSDDNCADEECAPYRTNLGALLAGGTPRGSTESPKIRALSDDAIKKIVPPSAYDP